MAAAAASSARPAASWIVQEGPHGRGPAELLGPGPGRGPALLLGPGQDRRHPGRQVLAGHADPASPITSGSAESALTTTGVPQASASSAASPKVSAGPGAMATSALASSAASSVASGRKPANVTGSRRAPRARSSRPRSGPSPATTSRRASPPRAGWPACSASAAASSPPTAARSARAGSRPAPRSVSRTAGLAPRRWPGRRRAGARIRLAAPIRSNSAAAHAGGADHPLDTRGRAPVDRVDRGPGQAPTGTARGRSSPGTASLSSAVRLSCEIMTAGTPCSRAHRPVQRSVVRSDTSSVSGRSSAQQRGEPAAGQQHPVPAGERQPRPAQGDHPALRGLLVAARSPGMISTGSWPAAR